MSPDAAATAKIREIASHSNIDVVLTTHPHTAVDNVEVRQLPPGGSVQTVES